MRVSCSICGMTWCLLVIAGLVSPLYAQDGFEGALEQWITNLSSLDMGLNDPAAKTKVDAKQAEIAKGLLWKEWVERNREELSAAVEKKVVSIPGAGDSRIELKWLERRFGDDKARGKPLFISMHGGGGAPERVNNQQWNNQIRLYAPTEGIVVAPRAPGNTWDLWHQAPVDRLFEELITAFVTTQNVDPNRVYLMGYSAGGDGVYQVAPRLADRFAAASMMAGHPNESQPLGLRNLPFALFVGEKDGAYNRNQVAMAYGKRLDELQKEDPDGYVHWMKLSPGKEHWMGGEDQEAVPWMMQYRRVVHPPVVVWYQDDVTHQSLYWLHLGENAEAKPGTKIVAKIEGNRIRIDGDAGVALRLQLDDSMLNLEEPIIVERNGTTVFEGKVARQIDVILQSILEYRDPARIYVATINVPGR